MFSTSSEKSLLSRKICFSKEDNNTYYDCTKLTMIMPQRLNVQKFGGALDYD